MGQENYDAVQAYDGSEEHKAKLSHQVLGGAVGYEAIKAYNEHKAKNGEPVDHAKAKEILGGLVSAGLTRLVETKGLDFIDAQKAKREAESQAFRDAGLDD